MRQRTYAAGLRAQCERNPQGSSGARGGYRPSQISPELVEKEWMKFTGGIANW